MAKFEAIVGKAVPKSKPCKGLVFRCELTSWVGGKGDVNFRERYHLVKSKSCPGCDQCGPIEEDLREFTVNNTAYPDILHGGEHGKLYTVRATNMSHDWETGILDDWDLEFVEYEEPEECETQNKS